MQIGNFESRACSFKVSPPLLKNGHIRSFFDPYTKAIVIKIAPLFLSEFVNFKRKNKYFSFCLFSSFERLVLKIRGTSLETL